MRIRDWSKFIAGNPSAILLGAVVSTRLPLALTLDNTGKKLPTPYKLFCEWLETSLNGIWSTVAVPQGFIIGITDEADKIMIASAYGPIRHRGFKVAGKSIGVLNYADGNYVKLATDCGYSLNI